MQFVEKSLFREGILKPGPFTESYDLRCYEPSEALQPYIEHYFISRRRSKFDADYIGHDVLSQPVVSLFIRPGEAYFEGPLTQKRTLAAKDSPIYVGAQFRPGGFHPFWKRHIQELSEKVIPASMILSALDAASIDELLAHDTNQAILTKIETMLQSCGPVYDPNIALLDKIITEIEQSGGMTTVADVATSNGISERTLQYLFQVYIGVGAKWSIKRVRFLEVIKFAREQEKPDWTHIAAQFGYSDQSHFSNDFKSIIGLPPSQFMG
jgi:AraC-like DNA-binding protein